MKEPLLEEVDKWIDDYFSKVTDEQLREDLKAAGYDFYKHIKAKIFSDEPTLSEMMEQVAEKKDRIYLFSFVKRKQQDWHISIGEYPAGGKTEGEGPTPEAALKAAMEEMEK